MDVLKIAEYAKIAALRSSHFLTFSRLNPTVKISNGRYREFFFWKGSEMWRKKEVNRDIWV